MRVVCIDIDSLRFDHVRAYGHEAPITPNIDALAEDAVRFANAYVAGSPCMPSRAGLISGRYGIHNGIVTHGKAAQLIRSPQNQTDWFAGWAENWSGETRNSLAEWNGESRNWLTLPEVFFHERVRTCGISSFPRHTAPFFYHLWHEFYQPQEPDGEAEYFQTPRAETVIDLALDFVERNRTDDFFLYTQMWEPHTPYNRPQEEVDELLDTPLPPYPTEEQISEHQEWTWSSANHIGISSRDDLRRLFANYDAEIRYADRQVGRVLDCLKEHGIYDDTFIMVTADHGEEFGEQGLYRQHGSTHEGTQHVPMIIKPPAGTGVDTGSRDHLITNVDIAPTIADYAGIDAPGHWQGQSLREILRDSNADKREFVVCDHGLYTAQRAIRTDRWKLIRTYHPGLWAEQIPDHQLYDMEADPWEQSDVASENPAVVQRLEAQMNEWVTRHQGDFPDPLLDVAESGPPAYLAGDEYWNKDISDDT